MSLRSFADGQDWALDIFEKVTQMRAQAWWRRGRIADLQTAGTYAINYLTGENHMRHYVSGGHAKRLARMIEGVAA